jgi:hypothetical protein
MLQKFNLELFLIEDMVRTYVHFFVLRFERNKDYFSLAELSGIVREMQYFMLDILENGIL